MSEKDEERAIRFAVNWMGSRNPNKVLEAWETYKRENAMHNTFYATMTEDGQLISEPPIEIKTWTGFYPKGKERHVRVDITVKEL